MQYQVIFTIGDTEELDLLMVTKGYRSDVIILDEKGNYYEVNFTELEVIKNGFDTEKVCYLEHNIVILHKVTKENVIRSIPELHQWLFYRRWLRLTKEQVVKFYYPKDNWKVILVTV